MWVLLLFLSPGGNTLSALLAYFYPVACMVVVCALTRTAWGLSPCSLSQLPCVLLSLQQPLGNTLQAMEAFAYGADEYVGKDVCLGVLAVFLPG